MIYGKVYTNLMKNFNEISSKNIIKLLNDKNITEPTEIQKNAIKAPF